MSDATQLLTTLAQIGGGFVAIIGGFIFSAVLSVEKQARILDKQYRNLSAQIYQEHIARGITAADIAAGRRKSEMEELSKPIYELTDEMQENKDSSVVSKALLCMLPMVIFGIFLPLVLMGTGFTNLSAIYRTMVVFCFLASTVAILWFIAWYIWHVHTSW